MDILTVAFPIVLPLIFFVPFLYFVSFRMEILFFVFVETVEAGCVLPVVIGGFMMEGLWIVVSGGVTWESFLK